MLGQICICLPYATNANERLLSMCSIPLLIHRIYFSCVAMFKTGLADFNRLGGWVQTSVRVSSLCVMQNEQARRQLLGRCFRCGGTHGAKSPKCAGVDSNVTKYPCGDPRLHEGVASIRGRSAFGQNTLLLYLKALTHRQSGNCPLELAGVRSS